ncbi:uncharacterized protein FTOL_01231 [Fusarium torulosum]|uniref:Uncharacterized protein n=1 Tax=Fusarium torulosum TaxID=33205 RepID=A0AAE8SD81_9HYPO|nr:uncharacterized protein FTOL_01231 [Fusarium torulosum]
MSTATSPFKIALYCIWSFQFGWLLTTSICSIFSGGNVPNPVALLLLLFPISFEGFLLFTAASCFPALSQWTRRLNKFFYETRDWAMILPVLTIVWLLGISMVAGFAAQDLIAGGGLLTKTLEFLNTRISSVIALVVYIGGIFTFIPLPFWTIYVGVQACIRVKNLKNPEEEAIGLTAKEDDEWNDFQDDRGN